MKMRIIGVSEGREEVLAIVEDWNVESITISTERQTQPEEKVGQRFAKMRWERIK